MQLPINYDDAHWSRRREARLEYVKLQNNKCWYCKNDLDGWPPGHIQAIRINTTLFPPNFFQHPVHLHHDHNSGMTIGAVHAKCNAVLWQVEGQ
jgi:hypothetical protein